MKNISTKGLTAAVRSALAAHDSENKSGRVRSIDSTDTAGIVQTIRRALRLRRPDDVELVITVHGGFVPNSYRYTPAGDRAEIRINLSAEVDGPRWKIAAWRGYAQKRSRGQGDYMIARLRRDGQPNGRIV